MFLLRFWWWCSLSWVAVFLMGRLIVFLQGRLIVFLQGRLVLFLLDVLSGSCSVDSVQVG